jgi:hypothetical protein
MAVPLRALARTDEGPACHIAALQGQVDPARVRALRLSCAQKHL